MIQFVFQHHRTLAAVLRTDSTRGRIVQQGRDESGCGWGQEVGFHLCRGKRLCWQISCGIWRKTSSRMPLALLPGEPEAQRCHFWNGEECQRKVSKLYLSHLNLDMLMNLSSRDVKQVVRYMSPEFMAKMGIWDINLRVTEYEVISPQQ